MTIDLGFAFLNENIAIIDVPGHEKFIRNMVAGVSTIDLALLVIAADDGIMPQTREHFDILKLLQLRHGIIALTKIDIGPRVGTIFRDNQMDRTIHLDSRSVRFGLGL